MVLSDLVSEDNISQLSLYQARIEDQLDVVYEVSQKISTMTDLMASEEGAVITQVAVDAMMSALGDGISVATPAGDTLRVMMKASGDLYEIAMTNADTFTHNVETIAFLTKSTSDYIVSSLNWAFDFGSGVYQDVRSLLTTGVAAAYSELSLYLDSIKAILSGAVEKGSDLISLLQDRIQSFGTQSSIAFEEFRNNILQYGSGNVTSIVYALQSKLSCAKNTVVNGLKLKFFRDDDNAREQWRITNVNISSAIKTGLVSLASMASSIIIMAGGVIVKSVATAFNVAASAWQKLKEFENSKEVSSISSESACLNAWYGTFLHAKLSDNSMIGNNNQLNRYSTVLYDDGLVKYLCTSTRTNINDDLSFDVRAYSRALYKITDQQLYVFMNNIMSLIYDIGYKANSGILLVYAKKRFSNVEAKEVYDYVKEEVLNYQVNQSEFDDLDDGYKIRSYYLGNVLSLLTRLFPTITSETDQLFYYSDNGTNRQGYLLPIFTNSINKYSDIHQAITDALESKLINPWHALFSVMSLPHCVVEVGKSNILEGVGWVCLNRIFTAISDASYYEMLNKEFDLNANYHAFSFSDDARAWCLDPDESIGITEHLCVTDQIVGNDIGYECFHDTLNVSTHNLAQSIQYADNASAIARYLPPKMAGQSISSFIKAVIISTAVAATVTAAVWTAFKITNGSRQARLYANYYQAVDNYNSDPSRDNFKALKKSNKAMRWNTKLFGESKYTGMLSYSAYGWGTDEDSSVDVDAPNTLSDTVRAAVQTKLVEAGVITDPNSGASDFTTIIQLLKTLVSLISG